MEEIIRKKNVVIMYPSYNEHNTLKDAPLRGANIKKKKKINKIMR